MFFAFISAVANASEASIGKYMMTNRGYQEASVYNMFFAAILSIIPLIKHWQFEFSIYSIGIFIILTIMQIPTLLYYNKLVCEIDIHKIEVYVRGYLIVTLIVDLLFGTFRLTFLSSMGIVLFFIGIYFLFTESNVMKNSEEKKLTIKAIVDNKIKIFLFTLCLIAWGIKPFIVKYSFTHNYFNNQTFTFLNFLLPAIYYYFLYRPKIVLSRDTLTKYTVQAFCKMSSVLFLNYGLLVSSVFLVSIIASTNIFMITLFSFLFLKAKVTKRQVGGVTLAFFSIVIMLFIGRS